MAMDLTERLSVLADDLAAGVELPPLRGARRARRRRRRLTRSGAVVVALGAVAVMLALVVPGSRHSVRVTTLSPTSNAAPRTPAPTTAKFGAIGARGKYAWAVTSTEFFVTTDQGAHWSSTPMPTRSGIPAVGQSGKLRLFTGRGNSVSFYTAAGPDRPWSKTNLTLVWPAKAPSGPLLGSNPPLSVELGNNAPGTVAAVVTQGGVQTGPVGLVLLSTDGGKTFHQLDPPTLSGGWEVAFTSATKGVIVGNSNNGPGEAVYYTTNGGVSWRPARLPGYRSTGTFKSTLGTPIVEGSHIYLSANLPATGGRLLELYASNNGGRTFVLKKSVRQTTTTFTPPRISVGGSNVWMVLNHGGTILRSPDGGTTWTAVSTSGLPVNGFVAGISLNGGNDAMAWVSSSSCTSFETDCSASVVPYATTDGGHHWHRAPAPTST